MTSFITFLPELTNVMWEQAYSLALAAKMAYENSDIIKVRLLSAFLSRKEEEEEEEEEEVSDGRKRSAR